MKRENVIAERVIAQLNRHKQNGFHVDSRLLSEVAKPGLSVLILEAEAEFLSLVWQATEATRPLTPKGQPRTLHDCAGRLIDFDWKFETLIKRGYTWFQQCADIDGKFDIEKVGWVAVTPLVAGEQKYTPNGSYYVYDGVHKSIVVAKRILRREFKYRPIKVLLLEPRRH